MPFNCIQETLRQRRFKLFIPNSCVMVSNETCGALEYVIRKIRYHSVQKNLSVYDGMDV